MTTKHTPGPWAVVEHPHSICVQTESPSKTKYGASRYAAIGGFDRNDRAQLEEAHANARLIAAAPDLLEALQEIMPFTATAAIGCNGYKCRESWCYSCNGEEEAEEAAQKGCDAYAKACVAIAKATGEEP